uniref:PduL/EutD family phosphate acyltransferase n=1 Tax=Caloramator sp. Dgby_cultured_2 TaxID=3029174 RepID=UPI0031587129
MEEYISSFVKNILRNIKCERLIPIEASGRHVHLSLQHVADLFGKDYELKIKKNYLKEASISIRKRYG